MAPVTPASDPIRLRWAVPLSVASGVLYFTGFAGFDRYYLMIFALVPLLVATDRSGPLRSLLLGWLMGTVTNLGGYYWVVGMLSRFSGFPLPLCILFTVLLCAYQGLTFGAFSLLLALLRRRGIEPFFTGAAALVVVERFFPLLFPSYMGNALYVHPLLIQTADIGGPSFVSFVLVSINMAIHCLLGVVLRGRQHLRVVHVSVAAALVPAALAYGWIRMGVMDSRSEIGERIKVGIVQVNMGIFDKREDPAEGLRRHREDSLRLEREAGVDLLVWPESAVVYSIPTGATRLKRRVLGDVSTPTIFGAVRSDLSPTEESIHNTAFLVDGDGTRLGYYDKVYLLAFGEYLPLGDAFPILYDLSPQSGHFTKGKGRTVLPFMGRRIAALICYEDILPRYVDKLMGASDQRPDLLVNITNDAWFGETTEPAIHLALATFRAVEQRRWLVRATNSGISAFVDPNGRIVESTPVMKRATLVHEVALLTGGTVYSSVGWLFDWICALAFVVSLVPGLRSSGRAGDGKDASGGPGRKRKRARHPGR